MHEQGWAIVVGAVAVAAALSVTTGACGDDDTDTVPSSTTGSTTGSMGGGGGSTSSGGATPSGGSGQGGGGSGEGGGGMGGSTAQVHGCDPLTADDRTSEDPVVLSWTNPHHECFIITTGTTVEWQGNFGLHPLAGGVSPTVDPQSPISQTDQGGSSTQVIFDGAGQYPYFCQVHTATMQGVIYVQ